MSEEAFNSQRCDLCQILQKSSSPTLPSHLTFLFKCSRFTHINIIIAKLRNTTLKTLQKSSSLTLQPDGTSDALSVFRYLLLEEPNERYFQCWSCLDLRMKLWNIRKCVQCTALSQKIYPTFTTREKHFSSFLTINSTFTLFRISWDLDQKLVWSLSWC